MLRKIQSASIKNKRVFIRCDFNVPTKDGKVLDDYRIKNSIETIKYVLKKKPEQIILASHLGRPEGYEKKLSLNPIIKVLEKYLKRKVYFADSGIIPKEKIVLLENLRFHAEEKEGSKSFANYLSAYVDIYINDAFGTAHRKDTSVYELPKLLPSYAGLLIQKEIKNLKLKQKKPTVAIFCSLKVKDKIPFLKKLLKEVDKVIIAGATEFTFFKSQGVEVGKSFVEEESFSEVDKLLKKYSSKIIFPVDFVGIARNKKISAPFDEIPKQMNCLDVGPKSVKLFKAVLKSAKSIIWNGSLGKFEEKPFDKSNNEVGKFVAKLNVDTLICGGDTVSSLSKIKFNKKKTYFSTGGGAALKFLAGEKMPALEVLKK